MASLVPHRSARGCLTCKRRRKKCDETKPTCQRCTNGRFQCLGYNHFETLGETTSRQALRKDHAATAMEKTSSLTSSDQAIQLRAVLHQSQPAVRLAVANDVLPDSEKLHRQPHETMRRLCISSPSPMDHVDFIVSQFMLFLRRSFRPFRFSPQEGIANLAKQSNLTCWCMYLGAQLVHNTSRRIKRDDFGDIVHRLHHQALTNSESESLETRLRCCHNLFSFNLLQSKTGLGYTLLKKSTFLFVELADKSPNLRSSSSKISLHSALTSPRLEIPQFASFDTVLSTVFGVPSLIHYDAIHCAPDSTPAKFRVMDSLYGWSTEMLWSLGKVNAWRVFRWMGLADTALFDWRDIQTEIECWHPAVDYIDDVPNVIGRFAVYEAWRQAALIYLYMGMCMVNSADPRVEAAVRQVVQLANTIESGGYLELHISIPCLIAGAAARLEKHRAALRDKLLYTRDEVWFIPGSDMVQVLDHLWHGAGAGGHPTTWEDYVDSRCQALPLGDVSNDS